jgi:hypothetical protein
MRLSVFVPKSKGKLEPGSMLVSRHTTHGPHCARETTQDLRAESGRSKRSSPGFPDERSGRSIPHLERFDLLNPVSAQILKGREPFWLVGPIAWI